MSDKSLDSGIELQGEKMKAVLEDPENAEILGYGVMYTVGSDWNTLVPRDWLLDRMDDLGLPLWIAPNEPRPSSAYKRAVKRMREDELEDIWVEAPRMDNGVEEGHRVSFDIRDGDGRNVKHLSAEVFFDEEESAQDGGTWVKHHLGHFNYDADTQQPTVTKDVDLDEDDLLFEVWERQVSLLYDLFDEMKVTHIGHDIRKMMYYTTRDYTSKVVSLRDGGAVYFFPADLIDFVDSMATLYDDIGSQWKVGGKTMAVRSFPIFKSDSDWVRERVEAALNESVDKAIDEAFDEYDEGETAKQVVEVIRNNLSSETDMAAQYNSLLEAELDIIELLKQRREGLNDEDKKEIIDKAIEDASDDI